MKTISLDKLKDECLGEVGTERRDAYELELKADLLALKLKEERKRQHVTQEELGNRLGVKKSYISSIENARHNVSLDVLQKIAYALGVGIDYTLYPLR